MSVKKIVPAAALTVFEFNVSFLYSDLTNEFVLFTGINI